MKIKSLLAPKSFMKRIQADDPRDPLLLQVLPDPKEKINNHKCLTDPLEEKNFNPVPGVLHKYYGRALILVTEACFIRCRYCFRKNFSYSKNIANPNNLPNIIHYLKQHKNIKEIILSGGDPLVANNNYFNNLINLLNPIKHIKTIRIHSRAPIVTPARINQDLINILTQSRFKIILVLHCNHPNEINQEVTKYFMLFKNTNITLLNQTVLLKNINNNAKTLAKLSYKLFDLNILPYYLHLLNPVTGTNHFKVSLTQAKKIFTQLQKILPGYLVPKLATEKPGEKYKLIIGNDHDHI